MGPGSIWTPTVIWSGSSDTLLTSHWVLSQIYIDDTQAYLHCAHCAAAAAVRSMQGAMDVLALWMSSNRLRLNASKTLFIWFSTRQQLAKLDFGALAADAEFPFLAFSTTVRDLDQELFVTSPYRLELVHCCCFYQLRQLRVVSRSLTFRVAVTLIHTFVL